MGQVDVGNNQTGLNADTSFAALNGTILVPVGGYLPVGYPVARNITALQGNYLSKYASLPGLSQFAGGDDFVSLPLSGFQSGATLTTGAAVAIGLPVTTAKVTAGALAAAGTVLSGFLVKTFLKAYQMASRQMSYYYGQPLVHCYLLHAEWLASEARQQFGDKEGLSLLQEVIDASIKAGTDAQDHLLRMQEHDFERRRTRSAHRPTTPHHENMSQQPPVPNTVGSLSGARHEMV